MTYTNLMRILTYKYNNFIMIIKTIINKTNNKFKKLKLKCNKIINKTNKINFSKYKNYKYKVNLYQ